MTAINSIPTLIQSPSIGSTTPIANNEKTVPSSPEPSTTSSFGPAAEVSLSTSAKAISADQEASAAKPVSAPPQEASRQPTTAAVATTHLTYNSTASNISSAKNKVALQVGVVAANQLVDKKGNIDKIKLADILSNQQAQTKAVTDANTQSVVE